MKILIVNDDGYRGPGLHALVNALKEEHELTVAVPATEKSGTSNSITFLTPLMARKAFVPEVDLDVWTIAGTPADCTVIALDQLCKEKPDIVISGINNGLNIGNAVMYSGTIAAGLQGYQAGIPTFALSNDFRCTDFNVTARLFKKMLPKFMENEKESLFFYNINFPVLPLEKIKGIKRTEISEGRMVDSFEKRTNPYGEDYFWHVYDGDKGVLQCANPNSDVAALVDGYISVTPVQLSYFDEKKFSEMPDYGAILSDLISG